MNLEEKIEKAFANIIDENIKKAEDGENIENQNVENPESDEDKNVEMALSFLKKGNYKNENEMIAAMKKEGYDKAICKKAIMKYNTGKMKKSIDENLSVQETKEDIKKSFDSEKDSEIDVTEYLENLPGLFDNFETNIVKSMQEGRDVNIAIAKGMKIIGHAIADINERINEVNDIVKAFAKQPIQKGVKGGIIEKSFDKSEKDDKEVKDDSILKSSDSIEIQQALLKINTPESRETLRKFSTNANFELLKNFRNEIESHTGKKMPA